jgi:hypothetical protein
MPQNDSSMYRPVLSNITATNGDRSVEPTRRKSQRHSLGVMFQDPVTTNGNQPPLPTTRPASLQTSYSTNDVPTVRKSLNMDMAPPKTTAEQQFRNHNINMGRIPNGAGANRQSREYGNGVMSDKTAVPQNGLQGAAPYGTGYESNIMGMGSGYGGPSTYSAANMAANGFINGQNGNTQGYGFNNGGYGNNYAKSGDAATRGGRRNFDETRFNNAPLSTYQGRMYELCKDQHGCRYLQRKLEEGVPDQIEFIFQETYPYIIELMTDPFGNYLCQKLFEHCNEQQRNVLIATSSPALAVIAENQHGTRALQKMIEFLHTSEQVAMVTAALDPWVVKLVQDLNGNHVIQKCLTRLGAEQSQFIYDSVAKNCVQVGTHRHGCCVLQRCIDHSQGVQRANLIGQIISCAFDLVQDPFGNYVVQYILDLDEPVFTKPLCESFHGKVVALSKQKFSSNVIEKCLRTADMDTKRALVEEMIGSELERMLRDSFANYVVQTALDHVDPSTRARLSDAIKPILPAIKSTPHGRRIAGKIVNHQEPAHGPAPPVAPPVDNYSMSTGRASGRRQIQIVGGGFNVPRANVPNYSHNGQNGDHGFVNGNGVTNGYGNGVPPNSGPHEMYAPQGYGYANGHLGNGFI